MPTTQQILERSAPQRYGDLPVDVGPAISGYGSMYDQLFQANPYRNLTYNKSLIQSILSGLGFRTKYDDFVDQARINAQEYDAGIFSMMQQNEYNLPSAQADRERAAGLNPDLVGLGDSVAAASPTEDPNGMNLSPSQEIEPLSCLQFVSQKVLDIVPSTMSFITNLAQLRGIRAENDLKEMSFNQNAIDAANSFFLEGLSEQDYKDAFDSQNFDNLLAAAKKNSDSLAASLFSSKKSRSRFNLAYQMHTRSMLAEISKYKTWDEFEKNRKSLLEQRSSPYFSDDDKTMQGLLSKVTGPLQRYQQKLAEINERYANKALSLNIPEDTAVLEDTQIANQQQYENAIDPAAQATAENTANERMTQENEIMTATNDLFSEMMSALEEDSDKWWSGLAKTLIGITRALVLSNLHASFGRRQMINSKTGQVEDLGMFNFGM